MCAKKISTHRKFAFGSKRIGYSIATCLYTQKNRPNLFVSTFWLTTLEFQLVWYYNAGIELYHR